MSKQARQQQYRDKLKDPRWQKKRLQILERDGWACRKCGDDENTLHVHHLDYYGGDPWDAPDRWLVALCADCHEEETRYMQVAMRSITNAFRLTFWAVEIDGIGECLADLNFDSEAREGIFQRFLSDPEVYEFARQKYFSGLRLHGEEPGEND